jgi:hypothetical protein
MTDNKHTITLPPELVQQWVDEIHGGSGVFVGTSDKCLAELAAQWGADQELEACCEELFRIWDSEEVETLDEFLKCLRAGRRHKTLSLKENLKKAILDGDERLALKLLEQLRDD